MSDVIRYTHCGKCTSMVPIGKMCPICKKEATPHVVENPRHLIHKGSEMDEGGRVGVQTVMNNGKVYAAVTLD